MNSRILVGFMGAGKTTIGQAMAKQRELPFYDSDNLIAEKTGQSIPDYFLTSGVANFRAQEVQVLQGYLAKPDGILATGGGVVDNINSLRLLEQTNVPIIYLQASFGTIAERLMDDINRPILQQNSFKEVASLYKKRSTQYEQLADQIVNVDLLAPKEIVEKLR